MQQRFVQSGVTLVELMISVTIGLLIIGALSYIYVGSRAAYRTNENLARVQETGRFALDWLMRDIRSAGFAGCVNLRAPDPVTKQPPIKGKARLPGATVPLSLDASTTIEGYKASAWPAAPNYALATTDVLTVRSGSEGGVALAEPNNVAAATIKLVNNCLGLKPKDAIVIANCDRGYLLRVTNAAEIPKKCDPSATDNSVTVEHALGTSTDGGNGILSDADSNQIEAFAAETQAKVFSFQEKTYFVGTSPTSGRRALFRIVNGGTPEEVVENVEDLALEYGLNSAGAVSAPADQYKSAGQMTNADWPNVRSIRVTVLVAGPDDATTTQAQSYAIRDADNDGALDVVTAPDRRLRQVFTTTVALRNRLN
jgi:type IV pilus assembly protein PilW